MLFPGLCGVCYDNLDRTNCTYGLGVCDRCAGELRLLTLGQSDTFGALVAKRNRGNRRLSSLDSANDPTDGGQANRAHAKRWLNLIRE